MKLQMKWLSFVLALCMILMGLGIPIHAQEGQATPEEPVLAEPAGTTNVTST